MEEKMEVFTKILVSIPEELNHKIDTLQLHEKRMNRGRLMRNKAQQIIRLAEIGMVEVMARIPEEDRGE